MATIVYVVSKKGKKFISTSTQGRAVIAGYKSRGQKVNYIRY